jgi:tetratricopeptide (TPR) repeat protein
VGSKDSLYKLFDLPITCTDDELRHAYLRAMRQHHPDRNPQRVDEATAQSQQVASAYEELKQWRTLSFGQSASTVNGLNTPVLKTDTRDETVVIKGIAKRKADFELEKFRYNSADPLSALRFLHTAFRAGRYHSDEIRNLIHSPLLIDSASLLISFEKKDAASETLVKWADILQQEQRLVDAVQILDDAFAAGVTTRSVTDSLRSMHYYWAQYGDPTTGQKATADVRIKHLRRILEVGFELDYVYKLLAEAYHELGKDAQAREHLRRAYELNPQLSGAVRISRALNFSYTPTPAKKESKAASQYRYSDPEQVPSPTRVNELARQNDWNTIIEFANPHEYSPRLRPKVRETLVEIAIVLGDCKSPKAIEALITLLKFQDYWNVSHAAMTSLAKLGDERILKLLETFQPGNSRGRALLSTCISNLRARIGSESLLVARQLSSQLLAQAERAFAEKDYGKSRALLESAMQNSSPSDAFYPESAILLARSCAKMGDERTSIELVRPLFDHLSERMRAAVAPDLASWLWSDLVFKQYAPSNDLHYLLALEIHLELALAAAGPTEVVTNLIKLTRWLEPLGAGEMAQWIRHVIRTEAPGTMYQDQDDRQRYVRQVELSSYIKGRLVSFDERVRAQVPVKLMHLLKGMTALDNRQHLLDE